MLVESKLCAWLQAGLALYRANPLMVESVFFDSSQVGVPTSRESGFLRDNTQLWLPDEYAGGTLRWAGQTYPILGNTPTTLVITGDPSLTEPDPCQPCYQIVPPAVQTLTEFLTTEKITIFSAFAQVPTELPAITIRLEKDAQGDTYLDETLHQTASNGVEFDIRQQAIQGSYLLSIWTNNREATLYLYAWLMTLALQSMPTFTRWGFYDVSFSGSDLDPSLTYLPERTYVRHFLLTASRMERAVETREVEWVSDFCVEVCAAYAQFHLTIPASA